MASRKHTGNDQTSLPFGALQLLAPPVRLVSAALWKVVKERDVMQYGVVEEFVTSACDTVPGLLTLRHQARLTLGLRARLVLELCRKQSDPKTIAVHMKRIRYCFTPKERDYKIKSAVETTHALVPKLLTDAAEREHFFEEVFPLAYGTNYDRELEKLLWEFLIRLDQLLPVPSLAQTVSWLNDAPPVLEECARAASQPQLLRILLKHQTCLGHLDPAASLPPNMGDGIITSLSLPPSGKVSSSVSTGIGSTSILKGPFIKPVIGLLSNDNVPLMVSMRRCSQSSETTKANEEHSKSLLSESYIRYTGAKEMQNKVNGHQGEGGAVGGMKRKHMDDCDRAADEEDVQRKAKWVKRRATTNDDYLCSIWVSCLKNHPRVVIEKLDTNPPESRADAPVKTTVCNSAPTRTHSTVDSFSGYDNKENTPNRTRRLAARLKSNAGNEYIDYSVSAQYLGSQLIFFTPEHHESSVLLIIHILSPQLFTKRYCKTKHGTYVPTLREYWKPCAERRNLLSPGSKHR
uniref:TERF1 (TRF1)-interacting nuclear factor 2 n=1 Tax=Neogobius melanostomus TaxID=47308 RepID=A0A8C6UCU2_9GOBI